MAEHPLACEAWQAAVAGWVVAQLDPHEETALLEHLGGCTPCRDEAASLLDVAAVALGADLGPLGADEAAPPVDLGDRVLARVARERRSRWAARAAVAMAATAAAVGAVVVATGVRGADDEPLRGEAVAFEQLAPGVEASGVLAGDGDSSMVLLSASGLEPDLTYTMWFTPPGGGYAEREAVGTFRADGAGNVEVDLQSALPLEEVGRVWVTTPDGDVALDTDPH